MQAKENEPSWVRPVAGGLSSCTAEIFTYPIDTSKIRLQLSGELGAQKQYNGMADALQKIARNEGASGLYKGISASLMRQASYRGLVFALYEPVRDAVGGGNSLGAKILAGGSAGMIGNFLVNPTDLVKVRLQADISGTRYRGVMHAFKTVAKEEGLRGMWKGATPSMQRAFIVNAAELATYDSAKQFIIDNGLPDGIASHGAASFLAGFVAAVTSTPVDVTKTRLMNQPVGPDGKGTLYKGMLDCVAQTVKREGPMGLYKGFLPTWLRIGPWAMLAFMTFEQYRSLMNSMTT